jgi:Tfp pilus assembly PilM family ATPase
MLFRAARHSGETMIRAIVTDIEGTTSDIRFVHNVLFPYARERLAPLSPRSSTPSRSRPFSITCAGNQTPRRQHRRTY